jgi:hypothetical protein
MQIVEISRSYAEMCAAAWSPVDFGGKHRCFVHAEKVLDHHSSISVTVTLVRGKRIERPL